MIEFHIASESLNSGSRTFSLFGKTRRWHWLVFSAWLSGSRRVRRIHRFVAPDIRFQIWIVGVPLELLLEASLGRR